MSTQPASKMRMGFDPRQRIYRDPFNEQFVFLMSAVPATVLIPLVLLAAGVIAGEQFGIGLFLGLTVVLELFLIFGIARPQMKPNERVGWALLWGASAAFFGFCFYHLVFANAV